MEQRGRRRPEGMKPRQQLVEHPCGTMQRGWEAGYCLMRGLEKVRTEGRLPVLASNLRRVVHLVERPRRLAARGGEGLGPAMPGAGVIVCYGFSWASVDAMSERCLMAFQPGTRCPGSAVLGCRVVVQAASPARGRGRVPVQASGGWKQSKLFSGGFYTVWCLVRCSFRKGLRLRSYA